MARQLRIEFADALYHVTSRGNERRPIFRADRDRRAFLDFLGQAARRFGWSVTAWVLMSNHFHLVIRVSPEWGQSFVLCRVAQEGGHSFVLRKAISDTTWRGPIHV